MLDIGKIIVSQGLMTPVELKSFQDSHSQSGDSRIDRQLVHEKKITEAKLLEAFADYFDLEFSTAIAPDSVHLDLIENVPLQYLKRYLILPIEKINGNLKVAVNDPFNLEPLNDLSHFFLADEVIPVLVPQREILSALNRAYGEVDSKADKIIQDLGQDEEEDFFTELEESADLLDETSEAPVIKLVNHIMNQAVKSRASDIHIEPFNSELVVRFRLDGVLYTQFNLPPKLHSAVSSRIKIMAKLNIAEKRVPQDGRIEIRIGDRNIDLRVSTIPTAFGERVVMRLLEKGMRLLKLHEIGLSDDLLVQIKELINISHGIVLVTGPTGSGKTTTLYAALNHINTPDKNILTIEDPVEYQLNGIGQMQANPKIGMTFARGLRSMLRQDPDVILVGEIRDLETAEIAIQAALTGHLVLSTLHTNDAPSAVTRLIDMGIEPFLITSAVRAIIAQRLIRLVCPVCREQYVPVPEQLEKWGISPDRMSGSTFFNSTGCDKCLNTGYKGRIGIYEFMKLTEPIKNLILQTSDSNQIRSLALQEGMISLREFGLNEVMKGKSTVDEILRVTQL